MFPPPTVALEKPTVPGCVAESRLSRLPTKMFRVTAGRARRQPHLRQAAGRLLRLRRRRVLFS